MGHIIQYSKSLIFSGHMLQYYLISPTVVFIMYSPLEKEKEVFAQN